MNRFRGVDLAVLLVVAGLLLTFVHDYAYRRVDTGGGDYEFGGLLSHAGVDMLIVTAVLGIVAWAWARHQRGGSDRGV